MSMFTYCCIFLILWNISSAEKYHLITMATSWSNSKRTCNIGGNVLLPDLSDNIKQDSSLYEKLPVNEFIWIDGVSIDIYFRETPVYAKLSYKPATSNVKYYLCVNESTNVTKRKSAPKFLTWSTARSNCEKERIKLLSISDKNSIKYVISMIEYDDDTWVGVDGKDPPVLREDEKLCMGMIKSSSGSVNLVVDDCSNKHQYICVHGDYEYRPTLTRLRDPMLKYKDKIQPTTQLEIITTEGINYSFVEDVVTSNTSITESSGTSKESDSSDGRSSGTLAGIIVGVTVLVLIVLGIFCGVYYRKRWLRRQAYQRSLHNYTKRQNSRRTDTGTFSNDTFRSTNSVDKTGDKKYEECQKDVIDECYKRNHERYISKPTASSSYSSSQGYHVMSGNNPNPVISYEGYDPDIGHIQKMHGYINQPIADQHSGTQVVSYTSKFPLNKQKMNILPEDSDQYEDPLKSTNIQVCLDDLDQYENEELGKSGKVSNEQSVDSLDDLDQYENYQVPKRRQKGVPVVKTTVTRSESIRSTKRSQFLKKNTNYTTAKSIDELDSYENYESPKTKPKNLRQDYMDEENYYDT